MTSADLHLDITLDLFKTGNLVARLPGRDARVEDVVHLFEREALRLRGGEEHVDEGQGVEGTEDHVHLPVDGPQQRRNGEGENAVPRPVRGRSQRDGLGADLGGEDLGWVCP
jgi:hypothetical protein